MDRPTIADLRISKPMDASPDKDSIYGVIPYVAPETISDRKHDECLIMDILDGLHHKILSKIPKELVELMNQSWHSDPKKREKFYTSYFDSLYYRFKELINKIEKEEIKFPESIYASASANKINEQAIYSSRLLNPLISNALTIQSGKRMFYVFLV
ncbi:hypothetical protein C2G38_2158614 [Gigaspora rosea]|uniref:Protein kinase domain-containing protein n=1 Tax=Gigaspora rosea TaxID=44941 RepID=A0A397W4C3_9GLOM|nr:hypothetical protein C2G38_2158614 [Gigaspora rosea]